MTGWYDINTDIMIQRVADILPGYELYWKTHILDMLKGGWVGMQAWNSQKHIFEIIIL